jgi:hypothetical protein
MAVKFKKPEIAVPEALASQAAPAPVEQVTKSHPIVAPLNQTKESPKMAVSFLKKGAAAAQAFQQEEARAEAQKNQVFRFNIPNGSSTALTFLDGEIVDGMLDIPFLYEHTINIAGKWQNFVCTQDSEPCPICEGGNKPSYVGLLTVVDHSSYTSKKDGKVYKDQIRLFVAKRTTIKMLTQMAIKRGGLTGCRFDVSRTGDKEPSVGNVYDFTEKLSLSALAPAYFAEHKKALAPISYEKEIGYMDASELRKMGFGHASNPIGKEAGVKESFADKL